MNRELNRTLKRLRRHLRSCAHSERAFRDAARTLAASALTPLPPRDRLCRPTPCRLAA